MTAISGKPQLALAQKGFSNINLFQAFGMCMDSEMGA